MLNFKKTHVDSLDWIPDLMAQELNHQYNCRGSETAP
jgi:hypothetical protein